MTLLALSILLAASAAPGSLIPKYLRCENLVEPLGIDATTPRLSWKLEATEAGARKLHQTAYHVLVSSTPEGLKNGTGDLWDSGKVNSGDSYGIEYAGKPLDSKEECYWKVQVWDQNGNGSDWSLSTRWRMGLLKPEDWQAKWIGYDPPEDHDQDYFKLAGADWIWSPTDKVGDAPAIKRYFTKTFSVSNPASLQKASLEVCADDHFELFLNGESIAKSKGGTDDWRTPNELDLKSKLKDGENEFKIVGENEKGWAGVLAKLILIDADGRESVVATDTSWTAHDTDGDAGKPAVVVAPFGGGPWAEMGFRMYRPAGFFRRGFTAKSGLKHAMVSCSALGLIDLHLNGKPVSDDLFTPGWEDYDKRVYYRTYDVTKSIKEGDNAVGAVLGDGWYSGYLGYAGKRANYGDRPRALVQVDLEYADGSHETIGSDADWKAADGPIRENDFLAGETYDARKELSGWDSPGYDDAHWKNAYVAEDAKPNLEAFPGDPVRPYEELKAKTIKEVKPGVYLLNYGQNLAGFARLKVHGEPGQKLVLRFGERLNPDGTLYTLNLRAAKCTDTYICKGGDEEWTPRFTFHGFQYAEITGLKSEPSGDDLVAIAISSATPEVGHIETSDAMLNKLSSNAWWTQKMNFIDIPTDCPQRDERLGWMGDAQAYIRTACMNSDVQAFFTKWLVSVDDSQSPEGQFPMVAPLKVAGQDGGPAWADAGVICPWTIYDVYGDKRLLAKHYPQMKKFVEFNHHRHTADLLPPKDVFCFGDWLNIHADTPHDVIAEAYWACSTRLVSEAAGVLGNKEDEKHYHHLYENIKAAFNKAYVSPDGEVKGNTQCAYVLALANDLLDGHVKERAIERFVADIQQRGMHLSTGFVGTRDIMHVLSKIGRNDVAFTLLHNTTYPSWGFTIVNGATSIWERWDGWTPEKGFQDPGMNSFAHYAFGSVVGWVYKEVGGIDNRSAGFAKILIAPQLDPDLTWANCSYDSVRGKIRSDWKLENGKLTMEVEVPPNSTAEVVVPRANASSQEGIRGKALGNSTVFEVGSGAYHFES